MSQFNVNASPISSFVTFGKGAPAQPAAMPGDPAAPVVNTTMLDAFAQLSTTVGQSLIQKSIEEDKQKELEEQQAQVDAAIRDAYQNGVRNVASLRDDGIIGDDLYVEKSVLSAQATIAAQNLKTRLSKGDLELAMDAGKLGSTKEGGMVSVIPLTEQDADFAAYYKTQLEGLEIPEEYSSNPFFLNAFEKAVGQVRLEAQDDYNDMMALRRRGVVNNVLVRDLRAAINSNDLDGVNALFTSEPDTTGEGVRVTFGTVGQLNVAGKALVDAAIQGSPFAKQLIEGELKLPGSKKSLLEDDRTAGVAAYYYENLDRIDNNISRNFDQLRGEAEDRMFNDAQRFVISELVENPSTTRESIDAMIEKSNGNLSRNVQGDLVLKIPTADGSKERKVPLEALIDEAASLTYSSIKDQLLENKFSEEQAIVVAASRTHRNGFYDYKSPELADSLDAGFAALETLQANPQAGEENLPDLQKSLDIFRVMRGQNMGMSAYMDRNQEFTMTALNFLEKGKVGPMQILGDQAPVPGNLRGAARRLQRFDPDKNPDKRKEFRDQLEVSLKDVDSNQYTRMQEMGEIFIALDLVPDAEKFANSLSEDGFFITGENYNYSFLSGINFTEEERETFLDGTIEFAANPKNKASEGSIAAEIRMIEEEFNITGEPAQQWISTRIRFVENANPQGGLMIVGKNGMSYGQKIYKRSDFENEVRTVVLPEKSRQVMTDPRNLKQKLKAGQATDNVPVNIGTGKAFDESIRQPLRNLMGMNGEELQSDQLDKAAESIKDLFELFPEPAPGGPNRQFPR